MAAAKRKRVDELEGALSVLLKRMDRIETESVTTKEVVANLEKAVQQLAGDIAAVRNIIDEQRATQSAAEAPSTIAPQLSSDPPLTQQRCVQLKALIVRSLQLCDSRLTIHV